jgi:hypothetical protein
MSTPYSDIYNVFLGKVSDFDYSNLTDAQINAILLPYLQSSTIRFKQCVNDLTQMDNVNNQFLVTLTFEEENILAVSMVVEWLNPKINNTLMLKSTLTDKDFQMFSQANQLKAVQSLKRETITELQRLITAYSYSSTKLLQGLVTTESYPPITDYGIGGNGNYGELV